MEARATEMVYMEVRSMGTSSNNNEEGYTVANNKLGMNTSATLASAPGLEPHQPTMSIIGGHGHWIYIYIYIYI